MKSDVPELRTEASMLLYFSTDDRPKLPLLSVLAVRQLQIAKAKAEKRILRKIGRPLRNMEVPNYRNDREWTNIAMTLQRSGSTTEHRRAEWGVSWKCSLTGAGSARLARSPRCSSAPGAPRLRRAAVALAVASARHARLPGSSAEAATLRAVGAVMEGGGVVKRMRLVLIAVVASLSRRRRMVCPRPARAPVRRSRAVAP